MIDAALIAAVTVIYLGGAIGAFVAIWRFADRSSVRADHPVIAAIGCVVFALAWPGTLAGVLVAENFRS